MNKERIEELNREHAEGQKDHFCDCGNELHSEEEIEMGVCNQCK